jgi:antirestriction factor ArdC-like protein
MARKANELRKTVKGYIAHLADETDAAQASEAMQDWIELLSKFHRYSVNNTWLIYCFRPDATLVKGYKSWQKLGRQVRRGEQGIPILAPCPYERRDPDTDEVVRRGMYFRVVYVFDVSQTDGEPLPEEPSWVTDGEGGEALTEALMAVAQGKEIKVNLEAEGLGEVRGSSSNGSVKVRAGLSSLGAAKTLAHELAHEMLHWGPERSRDRHIVEMEAEAVAYTVLRHFGLEGTGSPNYIALWQATREDLEGACERIAGTASELITAIEEVRA